MKISEEHWLLYSCYLKRRENIRWTSIWMMQTWLIVMNNYFSGTKYFVNIFSIFCMFLVLKTAYLYISRLNMSKRCKHQWKTSAYIYHSYITNVASLQGRTTTNRFTTGSCNRQTKCKWNNMRQLFDGDDRKGNFFSSQMSTDQKLRTILNKML